MKGTHSLVKDFLRVFDPYFTKYGLAIDSETEFKVVLSNEACTLIATSAQFEINIYIGPPGGRTKFLLKTAIEFLEPGLDLDKYLKLCEGDFGQRKKSDIECYGLLFDNYFPKINAGYLNWDALAKAEEENYAIRTFIHNTFIPGHELFYLISSGKDWKVKVKEYFEVNNIKM